MPHFAPGTDAFDIYIEYASDKGDKTKEWLADSCTINYFMQLILIVIGQEETWENASDAANTPF